MSKGRVLALCPKNDVLARAGALDGEPVIEYAAAVGGMSLRPEKGGKARGRFNEAEHWTTFPLPPQSVNGDFAADGLSDEPEEMAVVLGYCRACHQEFDLDMNELGNVLRANGNPVTCWPI